MTLLYFIAIHLFYLLLLPATWFSQKARLWVNGRKGWRTQLRQWKPKGSPTFWFHAASLGEFEQGLPVMEELKSTFSGCRLIVTFFSPSGYEVRKHYRNADLVCYLPLDTPYNARTWISTIKPDAVFFIKYEFWYFYLDHLYQSQIPVYLVSGIFRKQQIFFRWYGWWFRKKLTYFNRFFLQDNDSAMLLGTIGIHNTTVSGDTRFDRVAATAEKKRTIEVAEAFSAGGFCIVAGSTWPRDEELLAFFIHQADQNIKFILVPHEIDEAHIRHLENLIGKTSIRFSQASVSHVSGMQVLIIDNMGMLSSLYRYGQVAYIGGGFGKGIHNILEAAAFGIPVIFGPIHGKFREAGELLTCGGAFTIDSTDTLKRILDDLYRDAALRADSGAKAKEYVKENTGATAHIMQQVMQNTRIFHGNTL